MRESTLISHFQNKPENVCGYGSHLYNSIAAATRGPHTAGLPHCNH